MRKENPAPCFCFLDSKEVHQWIDKQEQEPIAGVQHGDGSFAHDCATMHTVFAAAWEGIFKCKHIASAEEFMKEYDGIIRNIARPVTFPKITGEDLKQQCLKRKLHDAGSLDNFKTAEI